MKVVKCEIATSWQRALNAARKTVGKKPLSKNPSPEWKSRMLLAEHSPIRLVEFDLSVEEIKQWVTTHIVRHWLGFIPFVRSQREDRRELNCKRDDLPQGSLNDMDFSANAQALISISRKRLCKMHPSPDTREAWTKVKSAVELVDKQMSEAMVPECIYRGFCPELKCCGFALTEEYKKQLELYRSQSHWYKLKTNQK